MSAVNDNTMTTRSPRVARRSRGRWQHGLSLVELMVALGLGAFITVGIIQMFTANRETYDVNMGQARLQENARFALDFLASPTRMAGFMGCVTDGADIENVLEPDPGPKPFEYDLQQIIQGHDATSAGMWSPDLTSLPAAIATARIASGTDVLIVRQADATGLRLTADMANSVAAINTVAPTAAQEAAFLRDSVLLLSDCERGAIFAVTNVPGSVAGGDTEFTFAHASGAVAGVANRNFRDNLTSDNTTFRSDAAVYPVMTHVFYVSSNVDASTASGFRENGSGNVILSLWRRSGNQPAAELVEGIEDLQLLYGVDTDQDGVPNRYRTIQNIADPNEIVTVRICVTSTSVDSVRSGAYQFQPCVGAVQTMTDGLLRRNFTKTIQLRNRI